MGETKKVTIVIMTMLWMEMVHTAIIEVEFGIAALL